MFADEGCTQYYDGTAVDRVYVRVNDNFNVNKTFITGSSEPDSIEIFSPNDGEADPWYVNVYIDFQSGDLDYPILAGNVYECINASGPVSVANPVTIFRES